MSKFCILSALKSEMVSGGRKASHCVSKTLLVFNAENLRNTSIHGCVVIFRCDNFSIDEENSLGDWRNAFGYRVESDGMVMILISSDYDRPVVIMPFEGNIWCGFLLAPFFIFLLFVEVKVYSKNYLTFCVFFVIYGLLVSNINNINKNETSN